MIHLLFTLLFANTIRFFDALTLSFDFQINSSIQKFL